MGVPGNLQEVDEQYETVTYLAKYLRENVLLKTAEEFSGVA